MYLACVITGDGFVAMLVTDDELDDDNEYDSDGSRNDNSTADSAEEGSVDLEDFSDSESILFELSNDQVGWVLSLFYC